MHVLIRIVESIMQVIKDLRSIIVSFIHRTSLCFNVHIVTKSLRKNQTSWYIWEHIQVKSLINAFTAPDSSQVVVIKMIIRDVTINKRNLFFLWVFAVGLIRADFVLENFIGSQRKKCIFLNTINKRYLIRKSFLIQSWMRVAA